MIGSHHSTKNILKGHRVSKVEDHLEATLNKLARPDCLTQGDATEVMLFICFPRLLPFCSTPFDHS